MGTSAIQQAALALALGAALPAQAALSIYTDVASWAAAISQAPTVIDFDALPDGTPLSGLYAGVSFGAFNGGSPLVVAYNFAQSGLNLLALSTPPLYGGGGGVSMTPTAPQQGLGFWYLDSELAGNSVAVMGAGGTLLGNFEMDFPAPAAWRFVGFVDANGISRVEVAIGAADMVALDTVMLAPVPEPAGASLSLLGVTLLAGVWRLRERRPS